MRHLRRVSDGGATSGVSVGVGRSDDVGGVEVLVDHDAGETGPIPKGLLLHVQRSRNFGVKVHVL